MERPTSLLVPLVAAVLGGVVGSLVTGWLRPAPAPSPKAGNSAVGPLAGDMEDLDTRVESLERQVARLQQPRPAQPAVQLPVIAAGAPAEAAAPAPRTAVDDPVFEAAVRDVMDRLQQERAAEHDSRNDQRRQQAVQRWADRFAEQAQLSVDQKAKVAEIAQEFAQRMRELRESDAGPVTREQWRERRDALREQSEKKLAESLTPRQMQAYRESEELRIDGAARGGGRGRGPMPND